MFVDPGCSHLLRFFFIFLFVLVRLIELSLRGGFPLRIGPANRARVLGVSPPLLPGGWDGTAKKR